MKKFFSLVLALVMALSLTTVAWGAATPVTTEGELKAALAAGGEVVLDADITLTASAENGNFEIPAGAGEVTLNLNGHSITAPTRTGYTDRTQYVFDNYADLTIKGTGTINSRGIQNYGKLTIENGVTVNAVDTNGGAGIWAYAGSETIINGGTFTAAEAAGCVNSAGKLTINGGTFTQTQSTAAYCYAINFSGTEGVINNATVNGAHGCVAVTAGTMTVKGGSFTTTGVNAQSDHVLYVSAGAKIVVEDGNFVGDHEAGGTSLYNNASTASVTGGTFSDDVSAYVAPGYSLDPATGVVSTKAAGGAADSTLYFWDSASAKWLVDYIAAGKDIDDLKSDDSDDCLPCFIIDGDYYVEVSDSAATFKLVYGKKTVFLKDVPSTAVCYDDEVKALTVVEEDDAECGDYYYADDYVESTDYDADDTFYASYTKKGLIDKVYVADSKNGTKQVLVGTKLVKANVVSYSVNGDSQVVFMDHVWAGYEVVNYKYVSVICDECGNVAKLYANATAAGKKAVKVLDAQDEVMGWITFADATNYGSSAGTYVPTTPSTDKVTSADTFDAGIAMYVGMSVMAAAGAVVLKKRED